MSDEGRFTMKFCIVLIVFFGLVVFALSNERLTGLHGWNFEAKREIAKIETLRADYIKSGKNNEDVLALVVKANMQIAEKKTILSTPFYNWTCSSKWNSVEPITIIPEYR